MTSIWKYHCDNLRKAVKGYMDAVQAYLVETDGDRSDEAESAAAEMEEAARAVDVAMTFCECQDAIEAAGKGGAK
jgi:hypothetical protein